MSEPLQVVIPMAGIGSRFKDYGFIQNKYLLPIDLNLTSMIEKAVISLDISVPCVYYFVINEENGLDIPLRNILKGIGKKYSYSYHICNVTKLTEGPATTVYSIVDMLNLNTPLLVSNSDQVLDWCFERFYTKCLEYDGCVLTYIPDYPLTMGATDKHSFIHLSDSGVIDECREKIVLSDHALVGVHYFKTAGIFKSAYEYMVFNNMRAPNGEFYLSLVYQSMIENQQKVGHCRIHDNEHFYPVGEPNDYFNYLYRHGGYIHEIKPIGGNNTEILYQDKQLRVVFSGEKIKIHINNPDIQNHVIVSKNTTVVVNINMDDHDNPTIWNIDDFVRGWFIGDFTPSIYKTNEYELGVLSHRKNEKWGFHYHIEADEINFLLEGRMKLNEKIIEKNSLFIIPKNQIACPVFLEDCQIICIKVPSVPTDKYIV